jgi:protein O-GlcNAc transferase
MGQFDRPRATGQDAADSSDSEADTGEQDGADSSDSKADTAGQDATRLIDEGHVLEAEGRLDEAMQCYLDAIRLAPNPARAHLNRGNILLLKGDLQGALDAFGTAIKHKPDYAGAYYNIGNALLGNKQLDEAAESYRQALRIEPDYAEVHCALGVTLYNQGKFSEAAESHRRALALKPDFVEAYTNLGNALLALRQFENAETRYRDALDIKPDLAEAHYGLGFSLKKLGRIDAALASFRLALQFKPDYAESHNNLGVTLKELGNLPEAEANFRRAQQLQPDNAVYRVAQAFTLPIAPQTEKDSLAVHVELDRAMQELAAWLLSSPMNQGQLAEAVGTHQPFYLAYRNANHVAILSRYGDLVSSSSAQIPIASILKPRKVRLVVVSNHVHRHSVWDVILRGILVNIDRARFDVVLYSTGRLEDNETKFAKSLCDVWRDSHSISNFNGWLDAMAADRPDVILYPEIGMDATALRLATHRLAPLQVASWGHPITTGLPTIDLFLSGELIEAPEADSHYRERLERLPGTGCCTTPISLKTVAIPELEAELAKRPGVRFVITHMPFKFDPSDDDLFASIAAAVGECTFVLINDPKFDWVTEQLIGRLSQALRKRNLDPGQHLLVIPWLSREKFYALLDQCDVYLDCPSFSGYTTAWQAIHRGLPVVTLEGEFMRQRLAAGLLRKIGLTDTIAASKDEYLDIAARLAAECRDPGHRNARRKALKVAAPQMDNDVGVVKAFEQSLIKALAERGRHFEFDVTEQRISDLSQPSKA